MRLTFKIIGVFFATIFLITCAVLNSIMPVVKDKDFIKEELQKSNFYGIANDEIKKQLKEKFSKYSNYFDVDDLVEHTIEENVIEDEVNKILDDFYNNENVVINLNGIVEKYRAAYSKYLEENNIELPEDVKQEMDKNFEDVPSEELDIEDVNKTYKNHGFKTFKAAMSIATYVVVFLVLVIFLINVLWAKRKLNGIYLPLMISGVFTFICYLSFKIKGDLVEIQTNNPELLEAATRVGERILRGMFRSGLIFMFIGAALIVIELFVRKTDMNKEKSN